MDWLLSALQGSCADVCGCVRRTMDEDSGNENDRKDMKRKMGKATTKEKDEGEIGAVKKWVRGGGAEVWLYLFLTSALD